MGLGRGVARLVSRSARDARVLVVARLESSRGEEPFDRVLVMSYASSESMATTSDTASVSSASDNGASDGERRARASAEPASASPRSQAAGEDPDAAPPPARRKKTRRRPFPISVNLSNCKYPLLRTVRKKLGWREVTDDAGDWQLYWTDTSVTVERVVRLKPTQKINHFVGMLEICRKKQLARNLAAMAAQFPDEFAFAPETFVLPAQLDAFLERFKTPRGGKRRRTFILKPDAGCQGKGIALAQTADGALSSLRAVGALREDGRSGATSVVAQKYLADPFLIHGYKFDLRVYALVLCADPLRVFVYGDGLARFCTERYEAPKASNLEQTCMHLTNYAVNKKNENFVFNSDASETGGGDGGSKWTIEGLRAYMEREGHDFDEVWADVTDLVVKTVISAQPALAHNYNRVMPPETGNDGYACFEILGIDVMLDAKLKPWLIEVNHSPSFTADTPLDLRVKEDLISDTLELVRIDPRAIKRAMAEEKASSLSRLMGTIAGPEGETNRGREQPSGSAASKNAPRRTLTPEEIQARRARLVAGREKWEETHSGAYELAYPSHDFERQKAYEAMMEGARAIHDERGGHARVRDVLARAKEKAGRRATEEEVKALFAKKGQRCPAGEKFQRAVDLAAAEKDRDGKVTWASVAPLVAAASQTRPGWDRNTRSDTPMLDGEELGRMAGGAAGRKQPGGLVSGPKLPPKLPKPPTAAIAVTDHREETLRRLLASREAESVAARATAMAKAGKLDDNGSAETSFDGQTASSRGYFASLKALLGTGVDATGRRGARPWAGRDSTSKSRPSSTTAGARSRPTSRGSDSGGGGDGAPALRLGITGDKVAFETGVDKTRRSRVVL